VVVLVAKKHKKLLPLRLIEDEPARELHEDYLDLDSTARIIAGTAVGTGGPFTLGVYAGWGQGKTSVLRLSMELVKGYSDAIVPVWFNAWQYEQEDHPIVPLLATIVREVDRKREDAERGKIKAVSEDVKAGWSKLSRALRAVAYGFSAKAKVGVPGFGEIEAGFVAKEMIERYDKLSASEDPLLERSLYFSAFELLEKLGTGGDAKDKPSGPRVVVFVDDLDRCMPPKAVKLLESIKLVLAQPGFIFVLAVDDRVIERFLNKRYKDEYGLDEYASGASYLDKIVQLPLPLAPHSERFVEYIKKMLAARLKGEYQESAEVLIELAPVLAVAADETPRSLVRLVNNLLVDLRLRQYTDGDDGLSDAEFLGLCAVARSLQHHLEHQQYRDLVADDDLCQRLADKSIDEIRREHSKKETGGVVGSRDERRGKLLRALEENRFVEGLLASEHGKRWLTDRDARNVADQVVKARPDEDARREAAKDSATIIEEEIRKILNKPTGQITREDREGITMLDLSGTGVTDMSSLSSLTQLEWLDLSYTGVTDVSALSSLSELEWLGLGGTGVTDVSSLSPLTQLRHLDLVCTGMTDVSSLSSLTQLRSLNLALMGATDVSSLSSLTQLQVLYLSGTGVMDVSSLSSLTQLQVLYLSDTGVTDVSSLSSLMQLQELYLMGTGMTDVSPLSSLTQLTYLSLSGTDVTDVSVLSSLTKLRQLDLENTGVTDVSPLSSLTQLQRLVLWDTGVKDVSALDGIPNLRIHGGPKR
jgi:hypothetical protein